MRSDYSCTALKGLSMSALKWKCKQTKAATQARIPPGHDSKSNYMYCAHNSKILNKLIRVIID